jgi:diguanylate cyclase (GGDEF)-like protein
MPPTSASGPPTAAAAPTVLVPVALLHTLLTIATVDSRTGVLGYRAWRVHALNRLTDQDRTTVPVALLVLDVDAFSSLNASHGHLAGDQILARVADVIQQAIAPDGVVGRVGGDEFVALLPAADAQQVAERIRAQVADLEVPVADPRTGPALARLTVSIGIAQSRSDATHRTAETVLTELFWAADNALYLAKDDGGNLVRVAGSRTDGTPDVPAAPTEARHSQAPKPADADHPAGSGFTDHCHDGLDLRLEINEAHGRVRTKLILSLAACRIRPARQRRVPGRSEPIRQGRIGGSACCSREELRSEPQCAPRVHRQEHPCSGVRRRHRDDGLQSVARPAPHEPRARSPARRSGRAEGFPARGSRVPVEPSPGLSRPTGWSREPTSIRLL